MSWVRKIFKQIPKNHYIVCVEQDEDGSIEVYHTESPFWYNFFHANEEKQQSKKKNKEKDCTSVSQCTKKEHIKIQSDNPNELVYWM